MLKIGKLKLGSSGRIVVPFNGAQNLMAAQKAGVEIAELRIDQFASSETSSVLSVISKFRGMTTLATIRSQKEGGGWRGTESARFQLFQAVIPQADAVDIELSSKSILPAVVRCAKRAGKLVIISYHNFKETPDTKILAKILKAAKSCGAGIVKIAVMAKTQADVRRLAAFTLAHASQNLIVIGMGKKGAVSRVLFPVLGSLLTYASWDKTVAPGQLSYQETFRCLKRFYSV